MRRTFLVSIMIALLLACAPSRACTLEEGETRAVARVEDAETVVLDDGSRVRLIGALGPRHGDAEADALFWQPAADARAALEQLVAGRTVRLGFAGRRTDRNGRLLAHLFLTDTADENEAWVQGRMVASGHARAYALPGAANCLEALVALERTARAAQLGLWIHAAYAVRAADPPGALLRHRNHFHLVEGAVREATEVKGQTYLNFGADWRTDFTVLMKNADGRALRSRGVRPADLVGWTIRVRGWITYRNGPFIELADANELEILAPPAEPLGERAVPPQRRAAAAR